jgi:hypothetical protein
VVKFKAAVLELTVLYRARGDLFWYLVATRVPSEQVVLEQDRTGDREFAKNMRVLSGPGMVLLIFSVTFRGIDWFMSLDPNGFRRSTV